MAKLIQADTTIFYIFLSKCKCEAFVDLILTIHPMIPIRTIWIISLNKISIQSVAVPIHLNRSKSVEKVKSEDPCGGSLLNLAFVSSLNEIFASLILRKELELFGINRTSPFLSNEVNSILVFHSQFDECSGH